jgi:DNA-binding transcriptional LysR family regulator
MVRPHNLCVKAMFAIPDMQMTDIEGVDLNLLGPLAALLSERHVSRAAERVNMSQPAMSRALRKLRDTLGDELLVRSQGGYQLTPRAERIQRQLAVLLPSLESLFSDETFDARTSAQAFRLAGTDYPVTLLGPALFQRVFQQSPNSTLQFEAWNHSAFNDIERGVIDLIFASGAAPPPLRSENLFDDHLVCLMSREHPLAAHPHITLDEYLACSHVVVNIADGQQGALDQRLQARGAPRRASLTVAFHAAAAAAVPGTMLVATLPWRLVTNNARDKTTRVIRAPTEFESMSFWMAWHPRLDNDPAQQWLRDTIRSLTPRP